MDWSGILLIVLIAILLIIGIIIFISQRIPKEESEAFLARLDEFSNDGMAPTLDEIELSQPFVERIIYPILRKVGETAAKNTQANVLGDLNRKIELAGKAGQLEASMLLSSRFFAAAILGFGTFAMCMFTILNQSFTRSVVFALIGGVIGFYFPQLWLHQQITTRQTSIKKAMPDALDLLTICVEAGLGFDQAMSNVAKKWDNELSHAFGRVTKEIQLGKTRRDALKSMSERIDLPEMSSFVAAIIQSEQLGVSMSKVLHIQSEQMRMLRRQYAEELAHQAPIKMLIPMVSLIFPSIFIVLLTPAILQIMRVSVFGGG